MKTITCFQAKRPLPRKTALVFAGALVLASAPLASAADYSSNSYNNGNYGYNDTQRDPSYGWSNTISDCVHGSTGISTNQDCSRNHASRHANDQSGNMTDTGYIDGNPYARTSAR